MGCYSTVVIYQGIEVKESAVPALLVRISLFTISLQRCIDLLSQ